MEILAESCEIFSLNPYTAPADQVPLGIG